MSGKKIATIICSIIFVLLLGFGVTWSVINFNKVQDAMSGSELFTKQELEEYGNNMYKQGLEDKQSYLDLINEYRDTITSLNDEVSKLEYDIQVKDEKIASKNTEITLLNNQLTAKLNELSELQNSNSVNLETISELEIEVEYLTSKLEILNKEVIILTKQKNDYLESINYYKNFISTLETETSAVATFEYDGQVVHMEVLTKGSYASFTPPTDTDYLIFNYWMVGTTIVDDLSTYPINTNTTFVANLDKSYDVKYYVEEVEYTSKIVLEGDYLPVVSAPSKSGYTFLGWSLDGDTLIDEDYIVESNVNLYAIFGALSWDVSYIVNDEVVHVEEVKTDNTPIGYTLESTDKKVFLGWSLDGVNVIDETTQIIKSDISFVALFEYYYSVNYVVDGISEHSTLIKSGDCVISYTPKSNSNYTFLGWTIDGSTIVDITTLEVTEDIQIIAKLKYLTFELSFTNVTATLNQNTFNNGIGFYSYRYNYDFSNYSSDDLSISLKYVIHNSDNTDTTINISNLKYGDDYDWYYYNYYPTSSNDIHYDISVEVFNGYVKFAVMFYGDSISGQRNCNFDVTLTFSVN